MALYPMPSREELIELNKNTEDGDGSVIDEWALTRTLDGSMGVFQYEMVYSPLTYGMGLAYCIAHDNIFASGGKATALAAFELYLKRMGSRFRADLTDEERKAAESLITSLADANPGLIFGRAKEMRKYLSRAY